MPPTQCIEECPQHESTHKTRVRHKQRHRSRTVSKTSLRGRQDRRMRVQEVSGKDVHNMSKPSKPGRSEVSTQQIQDLSGGGGSRVQGLGYRLVKGCLGVPGAVQGVPDRGAGASRQCRVFRGVKGFAGRVPASCMPYLAATTPQHPGFCAGGFTPSAVHPPISGC